MNLIGIAIKVRGKKKFIGKVGMAPDMYDVPDDIAGRRIFYREAKYKDAYSYTTKTIGIDAASTDLAEKYGADYVVTYCKDRHALFVAAMSEIRKTYSLDLGEYPQYRLGVKRWARFNVAKGLDMGYTRRVVVVEPKKIPPKSGNELLGHAKQLSFFGIKEE